ncbi:F0F1 ATP synthase subunit I, partial [Pseudomonas syringae]|nr:F0F1 ATP synthase subunit I [Pseudomonas syringae]
MESRMPDRLPFYRLAVFPLLLAQLIVLLIAALVLWQWQGSWLGVCLLLL